MQDSKEYTFTRDHINYYGKKWYPRGNPVASVIIVHGHGEHINRYPHVADFFNSQSVFVAGSDHVGHGKSSGKRGHAKSYELFLNEVESNIAMVKEEFPDIPCFLYGHSMGGAIVLQYGITRQPQGIAGVIASAPGLLPASDPGTLLTLARLLVHIYPSYTLNIGLDDSGMSHDPQELIAYQADPLTHEFVSARLVVDIIDVGQNVLKNIGRFPVPLLILQGSDDRMVSPDGARRCAEILQHRCTYKEWEGGYHDLHNDIMKQEVMAFIADWIKNRIY